MVVVPAEMAVARPLLLIVATDVLDEVQVTSVVLFRLTPPAKVPVASNCWVAPGAMTGLVGDMATELGASVPQLIEDTAKELRINMAETSLKRPGEKIFLIMIMDVHCKQRLKWSQILLIPLQDMQEMSQRDRSAGHRHEPGGRPSS